MTLEPLTVVILGQGSIGRRHAGLFAAAGCTVLAWDPGPEGPAVPGVRRVRELGAALSQASVAVVASPTSLHLEQAALCISNDCNVLIEKPLSTTGSGLRELGAEAAARGLVAAVAMNLRFHPGPATLRRLVADGDLGRPVVAFATCGSWLPGWRPGVDYRASYSARSELGGGVALDAIHELDYVTWILGPVTDVDARLERRSDLELDVEDVALFTLGHADGTLSTVALDYADRDYRRGMRVVGTRGSADWRWTDGTVHVVTEQGEQVLRAPADAASTYAAQAQAFLRAVRGEFQDVLCPLDAGAHAVRIVDAARRASVDGRRVAVA